MPDERSKNYIAKLSRDNRTVIIVCSECGRKAVCGQRVEHASACIRRFDRQK